MAAKKKRAQHPLDEIAEDWCGRQPWFKLPTKWNDKTVAVLCDEMCSVYTGSDGLFAPLEAEDQKAKVCRKALLKEIRFLRALTRTLRQSRSPSDEMKRVLDTANQAITNLETKRQRLLDSMTFAEVPPPPKKTGKGRRANANTQLIFDLEKVYRFHYKAASSTAIARKIHDILRQHSIASTSAENIVQKLRNAKLKN